MIVVSCAIGAYAIQNAMFDVWLMLIFGVVGYVFKKLGIPLAPFTLALVLGNRTEDAFRLSMIGAGGDLRVFWSNGLVGSITTLAFILLFWPILSRLLERAARLLRTGSNLMTELISGVATRVRSRPSCSIARKSSTP
jgi:TctA family transporter